MLCAQKYWERVPKITNTNPDHNTNPDRKHNPNLTLTPMSQTYYLTEIQLRHIGTVRFLINNWRHIDAELWTLLQHKRAQRRSIYLGHMSVV